MKNTTPNYSICLMSGLLLGLAVPSFSFAPLGFLAWAWLVPLLFKLEKTEKFRAFAARSLIAVGVGFTLITLWVVNASILGLFASMLMGILVWTVPFLWVYAARRFLNWTIAVWSLPFVWTAWEWIYHRSEFSFGAVRLGYTQGDLLWFVQYADLTGAEGVTFWLVLLNVSIYFFLRRQYETAEVKFDRAIVWNRNVVLPILLLSLPPVYAAFIFLKPQSPEKEIIVVAVQPNVSPFADYSPKQLPNIFAKPLALTDKAVKTEQPDLILWNEVAVPYILSDNTAANEYLAKQIVKWNAPVLTGLIEVKDYADGEERPPLLIAQKRTREFFNAAALFAPAQIQNGKLPMNLSELYTKRRLMPFLEHVPFSDRFPAVADLLIPIGTRPRLSYGETAKTFDFQTKDGETVRAGTMICYENLYPEISADLVRGGAQFLTAITNEGFFAGSQGQYQLAAFSRFRAIETRRAVVRSAATGMTRATDKFGRVTAEVPMWSEQILHARVALSDEQTFYVRFGDWLPVSCCLISLLLVLTVIGRSIRRVFII